MQSAAECCCKNSTLYALELIDDLVGDDEITVNSFNTFETGTINSFIDNEVVVLTRTSPANTAYVSICNIITITFGTQPPVDSTTNCATPECCCNTGIDRALRLLLNPTNPDSITFPVNFPSNSSLEIDIVDNTNAPISLSTVFGLCNGILWGQVQGAGNTFIAIPLCYIFSVSRQGSTTTN